MSRKTFSNHDMEIGIYTDVATGIRECGCQRGARKIAADVRL